jgi:branched-chain amino acid transport system ATP-binding protein
VLENVLVAADSHYGRLRERHGHRSARETLEYVGLAEVADAPASGLPYGTLKRVEIGRALVAQPRLLLLDEPAGGLSHEEVGELAAFVRRIRDDRDLTVLLVEHHMNLVMGVSDTVHVLDFGRLIATGPPELVRDDPAVIEAYLGPERPHVAS